MKKWGAVVHSFYIYFIIRMCAIIDKIIDNSRMNIIGLLLPHYYRSFHCFPLEDGTKKENNVSLNNSLRLISSIPI